MPSKPMACPRSVAHETIPANEEWRKVIVSGLETMEIMVLFLTDDFPESVSDQGMSRSMLK